MARLITSLAAAAVASLMLIGAASAQAPATGGQKMAPASKMAPAESSKADSKAEKPRTAASLECSKQADAKGLHGDARRKFRSECKKGVKAN
ncbi:MAG: phosphate starvation-inducible protein PsiF [Bradyrhizobiaceae bacterium PARB1]|jgi:psiF repeat|nr:MAG: phosphate starvation-inducible protein PsiF [Bradyrhizobiaceae bacterium PARB1]